MKIADGFILKKIADSFVVVPTGNNVVDFTAMITINETGAFIWELLKNDADMDYVVREMCKQYDIDSETALNDATEFLQVLENNKVLEK